MITNRTACRLTALALLAVGSAGLAGERVEGTQNFWYLAPQDVRVGRIMFRTKQIVAAADDSITFVPNSAWGRFTLKLSRVSGKPCARQGWPVSPKRKLIACKAIRLAEAGKLGEGQSLVLTGEITEVADGGKRMVGVFPFACEDLTVRIEVLDAAPAGPKPPPTIRNIRYGPHWQQTIDFYKAASDKPTPLVVKIHGGGWGALDKSGSWGYHRRLLPKGVSFASINYRFVGEAHRAGVKPPVQWPLGDAARAIQTLRHLAGKLNIDPKRVAAFGGSAGACSSLWLALHDDMADPASADPVARQSTRLFCAGGVGAQTSLDPHQMRAWIPSIAYGGHAFGFMDRDRKKRFQQFYDSRKRILPWIREYSPYEWASADDPPVYLDYHPRGLERGPREKGWPTHAPQFGVGLKKRLDELGVECYLRYKGKPSAQYKDLVDFLTRKLTRS